MNATLTAPAPAPLPPVRGPRLLTVADLAAMPTRLPSGDVRYELDDGRLVVMAPPGDIHGVEQGEFIYHLRVGGQEHGHGRVRGETGIVLRRNPDRVVGADAAFVLTKSHPVRRTREGYLETIPELVVEIRSPNDTGPEVLAKVDEYLVAGVVMVWVADPAARTVTAHRADRPPQVFAATDELVAPDLLPAFRVLVDRLFPE